MDDDQSAAGAIAFLAWSLLIAALVVGGGAWFALWAFAHGWLPLVGP